MKINVGLMGDYYSTIPAHQAIPIALVLAAKKIGVDVEFEWVPTEEIKDFSRISMFDGIWCVPGSPYKNMQGALYAIQFARERSISFSVHAGGFSMPSLSMLGMCWIGQMQSMKKRHLKPKITYS